MKIFTSLMILMLVILGPAVKADPSSILSQRDEKIYHLTVQKCSSGTARSAVQIAFESEALLEGATSWMLIASAQHMASVEKIQTNGLSKKIHQLRNSKGFWLAMSHCYGYKYGEINYGLLMKQLVDLTHLGTEVVSAAGALAVATSGVSLSSIVWQRFPLLSKFIISGLISSEVDHLIRLLQPLIFEKPLNSDELKKFEATKSAIFAEPDKQISAVKEIAQQAIRNIDQELRSNALAAPDKEILVAKKQKIINSLNELDRITRKNK